MNSRRLSATDAVNEAFRQALDNIGDSPVIYFAPGVYTLNATTLGNKSSKGHVTMVGFNGVYGESVELRMRGTMTIKHPIDISGIFFKSANSGASLKFRRDRLGSADQMEDDMDSSIYNCLFGGGKESTNVDIDYRGRNLTVRGCKFRTGKNGRAIKLSYFNNTAEESAQQDINGWKRIVIQDNNFHNYPSGCIEIDRPTNGSPKLRVLVVKDNVGETDSWLLRHTSNSIVLQNPNITGNSFMRYETNGKIIDLPKVEGGVIGLNTFSGTISPEKRLANHININDADGVVVAQNSFLYAGGKNGRGSLTGRFDGCTISENTWTGSSSNRYAFSGSGNKIVNNTP